MSKQISPIKCHLSLRLILCRKRSPRRFGADAFKHPVLAIDVTYDLGPGDRLMTVVQYTESSFRIYNPMSCVIIVMVTEQVARVSCPPLNFISRYARCGNGFGLDSDRIIRQGNARAREQKDCRKSFDAPTTTVHASGGRPRH